MYGVAVCGVPIAQNTSAIIRPPPRPQGQNPPLHDPGAARLQLEVVIFEPGVPLKAPPRVPLERVVVLSPDVGVDPADIEPVAASVGLDSAHGVEDGLDGGGSQTQPSIGREDSQALDVEDAGVRGAHTGVGAAREVGRVDSRGSVERTGLQAAD